MDKPLIKLTYTEKDGLMLPNVQISNNSVDNNQPLGKYGRMAMKYLQENQPQRFMILKMDGTLMEKMHKVHREAMEKIEYLTQQMMEKKPIPETEDIIERTRHLNSLQSTAEEIALNEIVYRMR